MHGSELLLIVDPAINPVDVENQLRLVLSHWQGPDRPETKQLSTHEFNEAPQDAMAGAAVVWLILEDEGSSVAYETIGQVIESHRPAVISLPGGDPVVSGYEEGMVACPLHAPAETMHTLLRSLMIQSPVMSDLRREIKLLRVQEAGLCNQIAQLDEELRMAAQLQKEFLPTEMPEVDGLGFDALWRPAGYVSGDIYDVVRLDETHIGLFIADAVGHGVPAALMSINIKRSMPTKVIDPGLENGYHVYTPGEALAELNKAMIECQSGKVRFATACYAVFNTQTNELTVARAGHPYPLVLRADGSTDTIEPEGGLLGVFPEEEFEHATIQLNPGDRVLLYSDGFEVAFDSEEDAETGQRKKLANDQYTQEFEDLRHGNAEAALERLAERLNMQSGSLNQRDDLTVVCLTVNKPAISQVCGSKPPAVNAA